MKKLLTLTIATLFGLTSAVSMAATTVQSATPQATPTKVVQSSTNTKHKKPVATQPAKQKTQAAQATTKHKKAAATKPAAKKSHTANKSSKHKKHVAAKSTTNAKAKSA